MTTTQEFEEIKRSPKSTSKNGEFSKCYISEESKFVYLEISENDVNKLRFYNEVLCKQIFVEQIGYDAIYKNFIFKVEKLQVWSWASYKYFKNIGIVAIDMMLPYYKEMAYKTHQIAEEYPELKEFTECLEWVLVNEITGIDMHSGNFGITEDGRLICFDPVCG